MTRSGCAGEQHGGRDEGGVLGNHSDGDMSREWGALGDRRMWSRNRKWDGDRMEIFGEQDDKMGLLVSDSFFPFFFPILCVIIMPAFIYGLLTQAFQQYNHMGLETFSFPVPWLEVA